ncbi:hypothetical protein KOI35_28335 [Actinoplanes bogorensis]|uniref:Uncharacterized protein n=1 Tax=Paractinoplanes bogorensis TaxID=1610840 RepID=A0ABS5YVR1_9ACTN|nr:hypothetical protein [Actinoplanes bogorensis]MBU2667426.1 hypothetical protein [Actinoplanes bogorensis]
MTEGSAEARAAEMVAAVRDDPGERLCLAARFYERPGIKAYRRAEVAFMRWQIRCGVLRARGGSAWWRAVNESLLRDAAEADLLFGRTNSPSNRSVEFWLVFLREPSPERWYRAHNSSIVAGYLRHHALVDGEGELERFFMDVALLRVLYAHCLLRRPRLALGRLAPLGKLLGDPRRRGADLFLSLKDVLPDAYPLAKVGIDKVLADENYLSRIVDYGVIVPRLQQLYEHSADDLDEPRLANLCRDGFPVYAWSYDQRYVWRTGKSPLAIGLARAVAGPAPFVEFGSGGNQDRR